MRWCVCGGSGCRGGNVVGSCRGSGTSVCYESSCCRGRTRRRTRTQRTRNLTSRMPETGTSGFVGAVGGNSHRDPALGSTFDPLARPWLDLAGSPLQIAQHDGGPVLFGEAAQLLVEQGLQVAGEVLVLHGSVVPVH